jgi:hypothetical protein
LSEAYNAAQFDEVNWMTLTAVLWVGGLLIAYTVGVFSNLTSPAIGNWIANWSQRSLANRISLLESRLAELEKVPAITEVEEQTLWGITSIKIAILNASNLFLIAAYFASSVLAADPLKLRLLGIIFIAPFVQNIFLILRMRYAHDFRYKHSPGRRAGLRKAIQDLKDIQNS